MASFRNHRVIIASLFLPTTAVLGESAPPTPEHLPPNGASPDMTLPAVSTRLAAAVSASADGHGGFVESVATNAKKPLKPALSSHNRQSSASGPLKSIVDDLKDKSRMATPTSRSPSNEIANPFTKLIRFAVEPESQDSAPTLPRKHQLTHPDTQSTPRLRRKQSRSSSRRPTFKAGPVSPTVDDASSSPFNVRWHMEPNPHCNGGLKNAVESVGDRMKKKLWVGTLGTPTDGFDGTLRRDIDERMLAQRDSLPVWIPDAEFQGCYDEFCHQVLWPCLHYAVPDAPKTKMFYESESYKQYAAVNQRFADAITSTYQEGDIIWVNDYHLLLLPTLLRLSPKIPPTTPIGFFMHVAFPSSEIFRCLSVRKDLLRGMLGADIVGFQTSNYARHWRQTVSRILSFEALPRGIQVPEGEGLTVSEMVEKERQKEDHEPEKRVRDGVVERGRFVDVGVFPMGIDVRQLHLKKHEPEVAEWVQVLKQRYAGMKIVVGRDKLDEIQGVRHKLLAFETFLEKYPSFQGQVVLIQVALQTSEPNEAAAGDVNDVVSHINSRFSTLTYQPVVFLHTQDLTFSQYLALLSVADAFIVTSLREGMALRTHEFVECQEGRWRPLILSEFTGSYSYSGFRSCIAINPWDTRGTANAIQQALTMSTEEARSRWEDLHNHVTTQTAQAFVTSFLTRCVRANTEHTASLDDPTSSLASLPVLKPTSLLPKYKHSQRRLILVDFEGTLWRRDLSKEGVLALGLGGVGGSENGFGGSESGFSGSEVGEGEDRVEEVKLPRQVEEAVEVLGKLAEDERRNEVWLLSGLRVKGVLEAVARRVPKVGIVAENGCFIKTRAVSSFGDEWINMVSNFNLTWKSACLEILNYFTERTPGSFIEERQASMVWRFWTDESESSNTADRQWAQRQAAEAQNHIFDSLGERYGLRIIPGRNSFLVMPNNISRSTAVGAILHPGGPGRSHNGHHYNHHHHHNAHVRSMSGSWVGSSPFPSSHSDGAASPVSTFSFTSTSSLPNVTSTTLFNTGKSFAPPPSMAADESSFGGFGYTSSGDGGGVHDIDFLLAISSDEKLLRRLGEFDGCETVSTSGKGTDARWKLESASEGGCVAVLRAFAGV
ncbi:glycosyltransferase family 20-domain-containing protein [Gymnopilus junonius]|uniref:Glycosyltransferase family 20-domain-containing protein n=1 Tax=Gymnopilus junonius TaxID=109634 RepID=A0A9P5NKC9_GYMJU|nr:glycosyltransferase family 20-domain-containing protein [Gymnopilus junonius]